MNASTRRLAVVLVAFVLTPQVLAAQKPVEQPTVSVGGLAVTIGGRVHTQFNTTTVDTEQPSELFLRRARLELAVRVSDRVSGTIQPDFAGDEVSMKDAYLNVAFSPAFQLLAGKAYRPFGLLEQTSSKRILPVERGLRIRGAEGADEYGLVSGLDYSDRDVGVQIVGAPGGAPLGLAYAAGVFRGPLHGEVGNRDSYQGAARVTIRPFAALRVGAGWSSRDFAAGAAAPDLRRGHAFEVDVEYGAFAPGFHLLGEVAAGDLDPFTGATFWGAQAWLAYRTGDIGAAGYRLEPLFRISHAATEPAGAAAPVAGGTLLTPGLNIYIDPLNRLMLNYDRWSPAGGGLDAGSFKAMFQFAF